ncbi:potassium channel family protein [Streptomyces sp. NRRL F-5135]|uniref:potassium channel family protein n=1 Tax=Streptomyces sp. NRRL F-5135 TaxID=1463858 RepID=UPI0006908B6B|nr:potassium channel protein [Streptomyces sp. NRRL F-5135]
MIVCGDDTLAHRLAGELRDVYGEQVVLVVPPARASRRPADPAAGLDRASSFFGRMSAAVTRTAAPGPGAGSGIGRDPAGAGERRGLLEAPDLDEEALVDAGVADAAALALVHDDDEVNIRAALAARRLNPQLRLVIRMYNRKLGQHLEELLDQAAAVAAPGLDAARLDASTTVLSDADTAAPALAATAVAGTSKVIRADGLMLRAVERNPPGPGEVADPGLCTLALLSATSSDPAGTEGSDNSGQEGPRLLPDDASAAAATGRGTVVLEAVSHAGPDLPPGRFSGRGASLASLFSRRLRWSFAGIVAAVLALALTSWLVTDAGPVRAVYLTLLDLFAINEPAVGEPADRQILQLLAGTAGLLLLPVGLAAVLEALGTFRTAASLRRPPRGLSGHVVLLGLGKIGSRVLVRLRELGIPVVCVEEDPEARGIPLARSLRVPTVVGDVTQEGVLEAAKIQRAHALLALTSADIINLEAALYARSLAPGLRVALRVYDDDFATAVYRTMRTVHPGALTRSRSVSTLAAPAFAIAMMGRQILGAIPVERKVLLVAAIDVAGHPWLEGRTIGEVFRPGAWRIIALDTAGPGDRVPDLADIRLDHEERRPAGLVWDLHPGYVLHARDRVVLAATRRGLAELLGRRSASRARRPPGGI